MKKIIYLIVIGLIGVQMFAFAQQKDYVPDFATNTRTQPGYFKNMADDWARGLTNMISAPLEIPVTVMKYHKEDPGLPGVKHAAGLVDGIVRTVMREGSGMWDMVVSFFPGSQAGAPVNPETLFTKTTD